MCAVVAAILIVLAGVLYGSYKLWIDPYRGTVEEFAPSEYGMDDTLSGEEAREDLAYLMKCLKRRHPAWLDGSGKDKLVQAQYEKEKSSIGEFVSLLELYRAEKVQPVDLFPRTRHVEAKTVEKSEIMTVSK